MEDVELAEDTCEWYAQDKDGNVWYFGKDSPKIKGDERFPGKGVLLKAIDPKQFH